MLELQAVIGAYSLALLGVSALGVLVDSGGHVEDVTHVAHLGVNGFPSISPASTAFAGIAKTYDEEGPAGPSSKMLAGTNSPFVLSVIRGAPGIKFTYEDPLVSDAHLVAESNGDAMAPQLHGAPSALHRGQGSRALHKTHAAGDIESFWTSNHPEAFPSTHAANRPNALIRTAAPNVSNPQANNMLPQNSTALGIWVEPRSRLLLISCMVINTVVACSLYLAARLQSKGALVPSPMAERKTVRMATSPQASKASSGELAPEVEVPSSNDASIAQAPGPSSTSVEGSTGGAAQTTTCQCRGFEGPNAWRDPTVDLQIGDVSLEAWTARRRSDSLKRLWACAVMAAVLLCTEVSVGVYIDSLALMSNGFHLLTDVAMYASLYFAVRNSDAAADRSSYSFGLHRLEVVGVLIALVGQYIITGNLVVTAVGHLFKPHMLIGQAGQIICLTATGSLMVNSCLAYWLGKTANVHSHSHVHGGMASRMARLHLITDAVQNSIVILTGGLLWIDPRLTILDTLCTFVFALLVIGSTLGFMRQLLFIVMERAPEDLDCEQMFKDIETITGVIGVHCCHAWSISQGKIAMSAHIHVDSGMQDDVLQEAQIIIKHRYGIHHMTLQVSDDEDLA